MRLVAALLCGTALFAACDEASNEPVAPEIETASQALVVEQALHLKEGVDTGIALKNKRNEPPPESFKVPAAGPPAGVKAESASERFERKRKLIETDRVRTGLPPQAAPVAKETLARYERFRAEQAREEANSQGVSAEVRERKRAALKHRIILEE